MGFGDKLGAAITGAVGANPINAALTPSKAPAAQTGDFPKRPQTAGHVTSGLDTAMRAQADKLHPVGGGLQKAVTGADWDK